MKKLIFIALCAAMLCGCTDRGPENAKNKTISKLNYACINGHLYLANYTNLGYEVYTPLFAEDSDAPMLVRCNSERGYK